MSKKILALVLAFAMMFSTITVAFAEGEVSAEAKALATVGMLEGDGNGVTVEYTAKEMTRLTAAASLLKLKGLYADATAFVGDANFADVDSVKWAEGKNILAYLKANPGLGFGGNEKGEFNAYGNINEQSYYKVLLETLGYKQTTAEVAGDFAWEETLTFAESKGLKATNAEKFTVDALAKATVAALKANVKDGKALIATLVEAGKVTEEKAVAAGLMEEAPAVTAALKSAKALGNALVEVKFDAEINEAAADVALYAIEGLEVKSAAVVDEKVVRLETAAMTSGTLYTLTVGEVKAKFAGIGKVTGAPAIETVVSEDVEEVVIDFDKNLDFESATNPANYTISGVEVVEADLDGDEVTLTTNGLTARKQYSVKVTNVKSVDGGLLKSASKSFYTRPDTAAPTVKGEVTVETNQRLVITFNEAVTKESAENIENYVIKTGTTELAVLSAVWDDDDEDNVELTTEEQTANKKYEISISNISDQTKAGNVMAKAVKKTFYGKREDTRLPLFKSAEVISRNHIEVAFTDDSRFDEDTILDVNNYTLTKSTDDYAVENAEKVSFKNGEYKVLLTVADLDLGSYTLKITNIADEFGNVMKDYKKVLSVTRDKFASATVSSYEVVDTDTIKVTFSKSLNEASAEDLANYTFNNDIGAPTKAEYKDKVVTLDVNEFVEGKEYKLTVKGVEDLAGNVLNLNFYFVAVKGSVDKDAPKLVDIYSVNEYVIAAVFDEEVSFTKGTTKLILDPAVGTGLDAKAYAEDDTVIEFSSSTKLDSTKEYKIAAGSFTGIKDAAGNDFVPGEANLGDYIVSGNDSEAEGSEVLSIAQINGTTFQVTMSKNVNIKDSTPTSVPSGTWNVDYDDSTDHTIVNFVKSSKILDVTPYYVEFDLSTILTDEHNLAVKDLDGDKTKFYVEFEDDEKPYIVNVVAKDRYTVEIEYNEEMGTVGSYTIKNADDTIKTTITTTPVIKSDKKFIKLTFTTPLEARYDYRLIIGSTAAKDLAGKVAEEVKDDEFYFNGTDLAPVDSNVADQKAVGAESMNYVDAVTVAKGVTATTDITSTVAALKAGLTATEGITVKVVAKEDVTYNYLTIAADGTVTLTKVAANGATDNVEVVVLEFTKGSAKATLEVTVTVEPQDAI